MPERRTIVVHGRPAIRHMTLTRNLLAALAQLSALYDKTDPFDD